MPRLFQGLFSGDMSSVVFSQSLSPFSYRAVGKYGFRLSSKAEVLAISFLNKKYSFHLQYPKIWVGDQPI